MKKLLLASFLSTCAFAQVNFSTSTTNLPIRPGQSATVTLSVSGTTAVAGVQWQLSTPPTGIGITYTTPLTSKNIDCLPTGVKCVVAALNTTTIPAGSSVAIATITVAANVAPGNIPLTWSGFVAATPTASPATIGTTPPTLTIKVLKKSDLNGDGTTDLLDYAIAISQVLGTTACTTADLDGNNVCDVVDVLGFSQP